MAKLGGLHLARLERRTKVERLDPLPVNVRRLGVGDGGADDFRDHPVGGIARGVVHV
jgi:hypothetical protein